ncbi:MAG: DUF924 family protein [Myxococcota bacterium]
MTAADVLTFWFGDWDDALPLADSDPQTIRWWGKVPEVDRTIQDRFGALHTELVHEGWRAWSDSPEDLLACVIVLDQFSRVVYRGQRQAYANDPRARALTQRALDLGWVASMSPIQRTFLLMPLVHAEDRASHSRATAMLGELVEEVAAAGSPRLDYYRRVLNHAVEHKQIIDRFGRYPHRNIVLERTSTPEELAYLQDETPGF